MRKTISCQKCKREAPEDKKKCSECKGTGTCQVIELTSLLVGAFARKAAGLILENLPTGAKLLLEPEPDNPYDPGAIKVLADQYEVPESRREALDQALGAYGLDWQTIDPVIFLGYVAAQEGKPLREARKAGEDLQGNRDFALALSALADEGPFPAKLGFAASGKPTVSIQVPAAAAAAHVA